MPAAYVAPLPAEGTFDTSLFAAFGSDDLNDLIAAAERDSTDLSAAIARVRGADADLATARATILTAVASTYFQVQSLRERIALAQLTLTAAQNTLSFVQARADVGLIGPAELAAQRAVVATAQLVVPQLEQQQSEALAALALLVGRAPEGFDVATRALDTLAEPAVAAGLPSELLTRRPDIRAAEHNLRAAHADWVAARAAVITLAGTGYSLTAGASLVQTIFDNGRRRAVTVEAAAREEELLAGYRVAVLSVLVDVENALTGLSHLEQQSKPQHENVVQSERAFEGSQLRYREGSTEYLTLLDSQRTLYAARDLECQYRLARLQGVLGLNKAPGGGWQTAGVAPFARAVSP